MKEAMTEEKKIERGYRETVSGEGKEIKWDRDSAKGRPMKES